MQGIGFLLWLIVAPVLVVNAHFAHLYRRHVDTPELGVLFQGNQQFKTKMQTENPTLLAHLTENGQEPEFMFIGCSDSRVSEGTIFNANPGTLFTERNIANQFVAEDVNAQSAVAYAVSELRVQHIIVMGHYGCGGVAAAIATPPEEPLDVANTAVQNWIAPIRALYQNSTRAEIVSLREKNAALKVVEEPEPKEAGFRALVEENIKVSVQAIASSTVIQDHFAALAQSGGVNEAGETLVHVFIHGLVYDIANGEIQNLGISVGPPGAEIPSVPFAAVSNGAVEPLENTSEDPLLVCQKLCKAKRDLF